MLSPNLTISITLLTWTGKDNGITINFIMLCETFLTDVNCDMFPLPGYQFICNNRSRGRGDGVALYIRDEFQYKIRHDMMINHDLEFETIFAEMNYQSHTCIIGEVYRVPNTNEQLSIQRYEAVLAKVSDFLMVMS